MVPENFYDNPCEAGQACSTKCDLFNAAHGAQQVAIPFFSPSRFFHLCTSYTVVSEQAAAVETERRTLISSLFIRIDEPGECPTQTGWDFRRPKSQRIRTQMPGSEKIRQSHSGKIPGTNKPKICLVQSTTAI
jgi:hypothetical protein